MLGCLAYSSTLKMEASNHSCCLLHADLLLGLFFGPEDEDDISADLLTYSWSGALLEKLQIVQLLMNFPAFYGTRRFIIVITRALHWSLS
jgi:hypothetical protein